MSDYEVEAKENLALALQSPGTYQHLTGDQLVAIAHVNATLALAEQQRIANLIAIQTGMVVGLRDGENLTLSASERWYALDAEVRTGMGV